MSVYAKAMAQKAREQKEKNFLETGYYETDIKRKRREQKIN
jgi:hypothetical protein